MKYTIDSIKALIVDEFLIYQAHQHQQGSPKADWKLVVAEQKEIFL